ncbi:serine/threonine-protein kinase [Oribacterium sp. KHPX15]|uniref:serine/threonine-protein kinase n=1 Tax=Oribacterium sp. KHPX15 TaxID=1855342 RepID=UPI000AED8AAC|nr:serine/threonine-protein kinase [Oribacterium sp. KHPX15]
MDKILLGRYKIIKEIGRGGMSDVYLAENITLHNYWAIKAVHKLNRGKIELLSEPNILKNLNHFALPRIVDITEDNENLYIIMDYVEGTNLRNLIEKEGCIKEKQILQWGVELCDVLGYLHGQKPPIIYRDMKPGNLIVDRDNHLKLIDFGIAIPADDAGQGAIFLTKGYAAPEQTNVHSQKDSRVDIYALGATLFAMATGKSPAQYGFPLPMANSINPDLTDGFSTIIQICTSVDPKTRFQNVDQLKHALTHVDTYNQSYRKQKRKQRSRAVASIVGVVLSMAVLFLGINIHFKEKQEAYNTLLLDAANAAAKSDFTNAESLFQKSIDMEPKLIEGYLGVASTYQKEQQYDKCLDYINNTVLTLFPDSIMDSRLNYIIGQTYEGKGKNQAALKYYEAAANYDTENPGYLQDYIISLINDDQIEKAKELVPRWETMSDSVDLENYIDVRTAIDTGNADEMLKVLDNCIAQNDNESITVKAIIDVSQELQDHGDKTSDVSCYTKAIDMLDYYSKNIRIELYPEITEQKGKAAYKAALETGDNAYYEEAADSFLKVLDLGYKKAYLYRNIAMIRQQQKDFKAGEDILDIMEKQYPDDYQSWYQRTMLRIAEQSELPAEQRDYSGVQDAWDHVKSMTEGTDTEGEVSSLRGLIKDLESQGLVRE